MVAAEILNSFSFFAGLSEAESARLAGIADIVAFRRGECIFREGEPADALFVLRDGWVDIEIKTDVRGNGQQLVTTLSPGEILGWSAVVEPYTYTASAVCASPVEAIAFEGADLLELFGADPELCSTITRRICQVIANRLHDTRLQMASLWVTH